MVRQDLLRAQRSPHFAYGLQPPNRVVRVVDDRAVVDRLALVGRAERPALDRVAFVRRVSGKLDDDDAKPVYVLTERGVGYRMGNRRTAEAKRPPVGDLVAPASELGVDVVEVAEGAGGKVGVA